MPLFFFYIVIGKIRFFAVGINVTCKYYLSLKSKPFKSIFYGSYTTKRCGKADGSFWMRKFSIDPTFALCIYIFNSILGFLILRHSILLFYYLKCPPQGLGDSEYFDYIIFLPFHTDHKIYSVACG